MRWSPNGRHGSNRDRKSTRLNSSHANISYAVFCLKKKISPSLRHRRQTLDRRARDPSTQSGRGGQAKPWSHADLTVQVLALFFKDTATTEIYTLSLHDALPILAMRVPPDQSTTCAEQAASASSGSRWRMARVTLVSRVPNRKVVTRLRSSVTACRKCRNSRVYWLIEPEISKSATIGGSFSRGPRYLRSITAPPAFMLARKVRRISIIYPRRLAVSRRVRSMSSGSASREIACLAAAISAAL